MVSRVSTRSAAAPEPERSVSRAARASGAAADDGHGRFPLSLTRWTGFVLAKAHHRAHSLFQAALAPLGVSPKGYGALTALAEIGPVSQAALGEALAIDRTTVVSVVDELERAGYVLRSRSASDRRIYALQLTKGGRRALATANAAAERAHAELLADLTDDERERLRSLLLRVV